MLRVGAPVGLVLRVPRAPAGDGVVQGDDGTEALRVAAGEAAKVVQREARALAPGQDE